MGKTKGKTYTDWRENERWTRRKEFWRTVQSFREMGFEVRVIDKYTYCFNESIVIDPAERTFNDLVKGIKGETKGQNLNVFLRQHFGLKV